MFRYNKYNHRIILSPGEDTYITGRFKNYRVSMSYEKLEQGSNSCVFVATDLSEEHGEEKIVKICRYHLDHKSRSQRIERFRREIEALKMAEKCRNVIRYEDEGVVEIKPAGGTSPIKFLCYIMEKGDHSLQGYLLHKNPSADIQDRLVFCKETLNAIKELHHIGVYHRDIKPNNVFIVGDVLKIGDLGLARFRNEDVPIDDPGERIGPFGWISPEVMNKFLTEKCSHGFSFDCGIDDKSDIFQLGQLFWFIFQANVPIGQIDKNDFLSGEKGILDIILGMIQYSKDRRIKIQDIESQFKPLYRKFGV